MLSCVGWVPGEGEVTTCMAADLGQQVAGDVLLGGWVPGGQDMVMKMAEDRGQLVIFF